MKISLLLIGDSFGLPKSRREPLLTHISTKHIPSRLLNFLRTLIISSFFLRGPSTYL